MFKIGDYVTRKKYNNDILFKIDRIDGNNIILSGVDLRLYADAAPSDLVLSTISRKNEEINNIRELDAKKYFYIPGTVLHFDSDKNYLDKCKNYYKKQNIKCNEYLFEEKEYKNHIVNLIKKHNPSIVVITGHDAHYKNNSYKNSKYFVESVKLIRNNFKKNILIVSGACQSDYSSLIKAGSTFASSPNHINIHALDPAIIASYLALTDINETVDLKIILNKTKFGPNGIGGILTKGMMLIGYPRIK